MNGRIPWSQLLALHPIARRLAPRFDAEALAEDLRKFGEDWWQTHAGPYHDGGWQSVSLWAPRGDPFEQRSSGGAFAGTPALAMAPAIRGVLDSFTAERNRIRLMRLGPGSSIHEHYDPLHTIDPDLVRLHVPIVTNEGVVFSVDGERVRMGAGEAWHVDVRFPHSVRNEGSAARVHLVLDLARNAELDRLMAEAEPVRSSRLTGYFLKQALPTGVRRRLGWDN